MAFVVQSHVRLHEWAAEEHGFFRGEGPDYEFGVEGFADGAAARESTASDVPMQVRSDPFEDVEGGEARMGRAPATGPST